MLIFIQCVMHNIFLLLQLPSILLLLFFFMSMMPRHREAVHVTLRQWFALVSERAGVDSCPGSSQAAAASSALMSGLGSNSIMESADWAPSHTMIHIYLHLLPCSVFCGWHGRFECSNPFLICEYFEHGCRFWLPCGSPGLCGMCLWLISFDCFYKLFCV